ncbi:MAG: HK97 gp10 family phage protein, partial [Actinomycetota bacterium]
MVAQVRIEGLRELQATLRRIDGQLPRLVRGRLREAAGIVAVEARARAPVRSGRLRRSIRPFARGNVAGVRVSARRR